MVETTTEASTETVLWRPAPAPGDLRIEPPPLPEDQAHVYSIPLEVSAEELDRFSATLSPGELARAGRFHFEVHRRRHIAARGTLRLILGSYLGVSPRTIEFDYGPNGKPALAGRHSGTGIQFNLAHSDELALVAVTRGAPLGIDVERVRVLKEFDELVARFFSRRENQLFQRLAPELKPPAFFNLWTRKEALLKATGEGIAHCLNQVEVTFLPGETARLLSVPAHFGNVGDWTLEELAATTGYTAALAVARKASAQ